MKHYIIVLVCISLLAACKKDEDPVNTDPDPVDCIPCLDTIAIDSIRGNIFSDCSGTPAAHELINITRMGVFEGEAVSYNTPIYTDVDGAFEYIYYVVAQNVEFGNSENLMGNIPSIGQTIFFKYYTDGNQYTEFSLSDSILLKVNFSFTSPYTSSDTLWFDKYYGATIDGINPQYIVGPFSDTTVYFPVYPAAWDYYVHDRHTNYIDYAISYSAFSETIATEPGLNSAYYTHEMCSPLDSVSIVVE